VFFGVAINCNFSMYTYITAIKFDLHCSMLLHFDSPRFSTIIIKII